MKRMEQQMAKVFISYSRKDIEFAKKLTGELQKSDLDFWIDWEGIPPTVDWWREIEKGIEEADVFLFLISPDSAKSKICGQEIDTAVKNGKRIIPIVVREIEWEDTPPQLGHLNYIFFSRDDDFDTALKKLLTAIQTDYEWAATHRQLQVKALEWERSNKENSFLLRGKELTDAESQLATNTSKEPHPTDLQREYVLISRQATDRQRRVVTAIAIAGAIALAALAIFGFVQAGIATQQRATAVANQQVAQTAKVDADNNAAVAQTAQANAEEQARVARVGELAAESVAFRESQAVYSLLLGVEAYRMQPDTRTRNVLFQNINTNPQVLQYFSGQAYILEGVAFSPDGKMLATSGFDKAVTVWNVETGQQLARLQNDVPATFRAVAFSPDGKIVAAGSDDHTIALWDVNTFKPIGTPLALHTDIIRYLAFSPDGKTLASASADKTIILWDLGTHQPIGEPFTGHSDVVYSVKFSPDGKTLVSGSVDRTVRLWDVQTHQQIGEPLNGHTDWVKTVAFSPDGSMIASGSVDKTIILWDAKTHQRIGDPLTGHSGEVRSVAFSPDGKTLASGSGDKTIILWDIQSR